MFDFGALGANPRIQFQLPTAWLHREWAASSFIMFLRNMMLDLCSRSHAAASALQYINILATLRHITTNVEKSTMAISFSWEIMFYPCLFKFIGWYWGEIHFRATDPHSCAYVHFIFQTCFPSRMTLPTNNFRPHIIYIYTVCILIVISLYFSMFIIWWLYGEYEWSMT